MIKVSITGEDIANNIRAERNRAKLTQEQTAKEVNITTRSYINYERNASAIKPVILYKLSLLFNCKISDFYVERNSTKCE